MLFVIVSFLLHPIQFVRDMKDSMRCPECGVAPHSLHKVGCKTGQADGGYWA